MHFVFLNRLSFFILILSLSLLTPCYCNNTKEINPLELSEYVTVTITVPESHADAIREAMGAAGAGRLGNYSHCSFSVKGIGRFIPNKGSSPYLGKEGVLEEVIEERIEAVCHRAVLEQVVEAIKNAIPYEETVVDIYPIYEIGRKKAKPSS
jgi:hypothetical protein